MDKIKIYYRMCAITNKDMELNPMINMLDEKAMKILFTKEQIKLFFKENSNDEYTYAETVVGGETKKAIHKPIDITTTKKIIIY